MNTQVSNNYLNRAFGLAVGNLYMYSLKTDIYTNQYKTGLSVIFRKGTIMNVIK